MQNQLTYLAVPYSHADPAIQRQRFEAANIAAGRLIQQGRVVFSPISHTHPIAERCELPRGWDYWERFDRTFLSRCDELIVLTLDGWETSQGVQAEIAIAREYGMSIVYLSLDEIAEMILAA